MYREHLEPFLAWKDEHKHKKTKVETEMPFDPLPDQLPDPPESLPDPWLNAFEGPWTTCAGYRPPSPQPSLPSLTSDIRKQLSNTTFNPKARKRKMFEGTMSMYGQPPQTATTSTSGLNSQTRDAASAEPSTPTPSSSTRPAI